MASAPVHIDGEMLLTVLLLAQEFNGDEQEQLFAEAPRLRSLLQRIGHLSGQLAAIYPGPPVDLADPQVRRDAVRLLDHLLYLDRLTQTPLVPRRPSRYGLHAVGLIPYQN